MKARRYLEQYRQALIETERLRLRLEKLESDKTSMQLSLDGMPKGKGGKANKERLERLIDDTDRLKLEAAEELTRLVMLRDEVEGVINAVPTQKYSYLLYCRYICNKAWERIADEMGKLFRVDDQPYSERWIYNLHEAALTEADEVLRKFEIN